MKLLTPGETVTQKERTAVRDTVRVHTLDKAIRDKKAELERIETQIQEMLLEGRKQWSVEHLEHLGKLAAVQREYDDLVESKSTYVMKLEAREKAVETKEEALSNREAALTRKGEENEEIREALETRLDEVSDREASAEIVSQRLASREKGIEAQEEQVRTQAAEVTKIITKGHADLEQAKVVLEREKATLIAREKSVKAREDSAAKKEAGFAERERAIQDRYNTLLRAEKEHQKKWQTSPNQSPK